MKKTNNATSDKSLTPLELVTLALHFRKPNEEKNPEDYFNEALSWIEKAKKRIDHLCRTGDIFLGLEKERKENLKMEAEGIHYFDFPNYSDQELLEEWMRHPSKNRKDLNLKTALSLKKTLDEIKEDTPEKFIENFKKAGSEVIEELWGDETPEAKNQLIKEAVLKSTVKLIFNYKKKQRGRKKALK